ncbi:type II secretion system F family protein [Lipingzhangella sp. LS1_29]|uniref:Type II secretion system F family protein n=1 Tax=Lipingzhangella rawalii TaxID=2055835 RepID=A0ABU2H401_9ACTN|nr:type II secretion system F family protein [Lipingzhangella rawalii]MDS1270021.1 type II secretion system F family protein [Lipingzhangella rawalii]
MSTATGLTLTAVAGAALLLLDTTPDPAQHRLRVLRAGTTRRQTRQPGCGTWREVVSSRLRARSQRTAWDRAQYVVELCQALAGELRAGHPPASGLAAAVDSLAERGRSELAVLRGSAAAGHDPVPELHRCALRPGAEGLCHLAACWRVAATAGGSLADAVTQLGVGLAAEQANRRELRAQLAGPRATALLVSLLPILGLALATATGAKPLEFLLTTPTGLVLLCVGLGLDLAGLYWTRRMVRGALAPGQAASWWKDQR